MKVSISKESKKVLTLEEASVAKQIITFFKSEDTMSASDYAKMAVDAIARFYDRHDYCTKVFEATAHIAKNNRVCNVIYKDSGNIDIWIEATAQTNSGFYIIGAYITDMWKISPDNMEEIAGNMYIQRFVKK